MKKLLSVGIALLALGAAHANAACTQANIAGIWALYSDGIVTAGTLNWSSCDLTINAAGVFTSKTSACVNSLGQQFNASGSMQILNASKCTYHGSLYVPAFNKTTYVRAFTLSIDHQVGNGVGGGDGGYGNPFVFNMVRVK